MTDPTHPSSEQSASPAVQRRLDILDTLADEGCVHTSEVAYIASYPLSTVRRDLEWMESEGLVRGVKHDERRILDGGRIRIYWNITDDGKRELERCRV